MFTNIVNYFTFKHFVLLAIAGIVIIAIAFFNNNLNDKSKKIILCSIWGILVLNLIVFMITNISKFNKNTVMYYPVEYGEAYTFGGLSFIPLIIMGRIIFKKDCEISKLFVFYFILSIGLFSCILKATSSYGYGSRFMNLTGIQIGILQDKNIVFYFIKTICYIIFPLLMVKFKLYKPRFSDIPKALIIISCCYICAYLYNVGMEQIQTNLDNFGGSLYNVKEYHSNLLYANKPGLYILEFFYEITGSIPLLYLIWTLPILTVIFIIYVLVFTDLKNYKLKEHFNSYFINLKEYWKKVFSRPIDFELKNKNEGGEE